MSTPLRPRTTVAFFVQAAISFAVSLSVTIIGIGYLHDPPVVRAFLALGLRYVVTASFTLAKCIRDRQEEEAVVSHWCRCRWCDRSRPRRAPSTAPGRRTPGRWPQGGLGQSERSPSCSEISLISSLFLMALRHYYCNERPCRGRH